MADASGYLLSLGDSLDSLRQRLPPADPAALEVVRATLATYSLATDAAGKSVSAATIAKLVALTNKVAASMPQTGADIVALMQEVWNLLDAVRNELSAA